MVNLGKLFYEVSRESIWHAFTGAEILDRFNVGVVVGVVVGVGPINSCRNSWKIIMDNCIWSWIRARVLGKDSKFYAWPSVTNVILDYL